MQIKSYIADNLRRRACDPNRLSEAIEQEQTAVAKLRRLALDEPSELHVSHLGRELSRLADHLLLADRPAEALPLKEEAVDIWKKLGRDKAVFLAELDAAEIVFELERHDQALEELDRLVELSEDEALSVYKDFALELRGRCLGRVGQGEQARQDLEQALGLRRERGNARQIEETQRLLAQAAQL